jgi:hypothetical protein
MLLPKEKFKFTGIFPEKKIAILATTPAKPGGKTTPTLLEWIFLLISAPSLREIKSNFFRLQKKGVGNP